MCFLKNFWNKFCLESDIIWHREGYFNTNKHPNICIQYQTCHNDISYMQRWDGWDWVELQSNRLDIICQHQNHVTVIYHYQILYISTSEPSASASLYILHYLWYHQHQHQHQHHHQHQDVKKAALSVISPGTHPDCCWQDGAGQTVRVLIKRITITITITVTAVFLSISTWQYTQICDYNCNHWNSREVIQGEVLIADRKKKENKNRRNQNITKRING